MLSLYDDGSALQTDASGAVVAVTNAAGDNVPVVAGNSSGSIGQQFANLVTNGVASLINSRLAPSVLTRPGAQATPGTSVSSLLASPVVKFAGLALLGFFLYKKLA